MTRFFLLPFVLLLTVLNLPAQTSADIIRAAHKRYYHAACKTYTFSQKNTDYKNDTVAGYSTWYEAIEFPDKFRIDYGSRSEGTFAIFRNDSVLRYKKGELVKSRSDSSSLLLLLGGMHYREIDDVLKRIWHANYNMDVLSTQKWMGSEAWVIGAKENDLSSNQVWIDKKTLMVMRLIGKMNNGDIMDMRFEAHQDWCRGKLENKVSFRRNGVLERLEEYYDIKTVNSFPAGPLGQ